MRAHDHGNVTAVDLVSIKRVVAQVNMQWLGLQGPLELAHQF